MKLARNMIYETVEGEEPRLFRILDISKTDVVVIEIGKEGLPEIAKAEALQGMFDDGVFRLVQTDFADSLLLPEDSLDAKAKEKRDARWEVISPIVGDIRMVWDEKRRWTLIKTQCEQTGKSATNIYILLRKYWEGGQVRNALLPKYVSAMKRKVNEGARRGKKPLAGGIVIGADEEKKFELGLKAFYEKKSKPSLTSAYRKTVARYFNTGYRLEGGTTVPILPPTEMLPTLRQFRYWFKKRNGETSLRAREGKKFNLKFRPIHGHSTAQSFGPGDLYQIDSTVGDIYLVSTLNPSVIVGRPTLYLVSDVFTRCIAGFNLTLESPSYAQAALAIENACADKVEFCRQFGIDISEEEWPCKGIPTNLVADRGELKGIQADQIEAGLGVCLTNCPPYRADMKGIVERTFQLGNKQLFHVLPGSVTKSQERGDADPRLAATLNIQELTKLVISWILTHNRKRMSHYPLNEEMLKDGVAPIPNAIWEWGLGQNQTLPYKRPSVIRTLLLPQGEAGVTPQGIRFKRAYYHSERALKEGWYTSARAGGGHKVPICFDPRDTSFIYLRHKDEVEICPIKEMSKPFAKKTWAEVEAYFYEQRLAQEQTRSQELQKDAELDAQISQIVKEAEKKVKGPKKSKSARTKDIRGNRKEEAERLKESGATTSPEGSPAAEDPDYTPPPDYTDMLKDLQKKQLEGESK